MTGLAKTIFSDFPSITFKSGKNFIWSPADKTIHYDPTRLVNDEGVLTLLHEISHASLNHNSYKSDLELLQMEVKAWAQARELAKTYSVNVDDDFIDNCLESYRQWLYKRSICVECGTNSLQDQQGIYHCHICGLKWQVPHSQLCRVQRRKVKTKTSSPKNE